MAESIIDLLEVIKIDKHDPESKTMPSRQG